MHYKLRSVLFFLFFLIYAAVFSSSLAIAHVTVAPKPSWVEEIDVKENKEVQAKDVSNGYRYIFTDIQINTIHKTSYYHYSRKLYTETGVQSGSELNFTYDPAFEKLIVHEIRIIRGGEEINKLDVSKIQLIQREENKENHIYDGSKLAYILLEDTRSGDIIEYSFSIIGFNPLYKGKFFRSFYLSFYDPTDFILFKLISPRERKYNIKSFNSTIEPAITESANTKIYRWELEKVKSITSDNETPGWYIDYPYVEISEFFSWTEVKDWAMEIYTLDKIKNQSLINKIKDINSTCLTNEERIVAALFFVQNDIRYTGMEAGIGGYKPTPPGQVFEQRFGDCKGKSFLFSYMLKEMGIQAYPALVSTNHRQEVKNYLPSPTEFDHCIAMVELNDKKYWYDPTIPNQRGKFDAIYFPDYRSALVLKDEPAEFTDIEFKGISKIEVKELFTLDSVGGNASLYVKTKYIGSDADYQRDFFSTSRIDQVAKNYLNYYAKKYSEVVATKEIRYEDDEENNVFTTHEEYLINNFWIQSDTDTNIIQASTYAQYIRDKITLPSTTIRKSPLALSYPAEVDQEIKVVFPEPWNIVNESKEIKGPGIVYRESISYEDNVLTLAYSYKTLKSYVEPQESAELIKKLNTIIDGLGYSFSYNLSVIEQEPGINYLMVFLGVLFLGIAIAIAYKIYKFDPEKNPVMEPQGYNVWMILFLIGSVVSFFMLCKDLYDLDYFNRTVWESINTPGLDSYNPALGLFLVIEFLFNIHLLVFTILLIILFLQKRSSIPILVPAYYIFNIVFLAADSMVVQWIVTASETDIRQSWMETFKVLVRGMIWGTYFWRSEDVRHTFVNTYRKKQPEPVIEERFERTYDPVNPE